MFDGAFPPDLLLRPGRKGKVFKCITFFSLEGGVEF